MANYYKSISLNPYQIFWVYIIPLEGFIKRMDYQKILDVLHPYTKHYNVNLGGKKM